MVRVVGAFDTLTVTGGEAELRKKLSPEYVAERDIGLSVRGVITVELVKVPAVERPIVPVIGKPDWNRARLPVNGLGEVTVPFVCTVAATLNGTPAWALTMVER